MARRQFPVFVLNEYGDHPITRTLQSLDLALVLGGARSGPTKIAAARRERDAAAAAADHAGELGRGERLSEEVGPNKTPTFDPDKGDVPTPLYLGAAAERDKG